VNEPLVSLRVNHTGRTITTNAVVGTVLLTAGSTRGGTAYRENLYV